MLDKRSLALLNILNEECFGIGYKVFFISDITASFPSPFAIDEAGVRECLKNLSDGEYVSVKYEDDIEFCATPTPKGRQIFESLSDERVERFRSAKMYFLYSFLGGLFGGIITVVIAVILFLLIGGA